MIHLSSNPNQYWALEKLKPAATPKSIVLTGESDQQWRGFGGCFNEIGWDQLSCLESSKRSQVLDDLFAPDGALKFNYCRLPIGASDYALSWYSLNEVDGDYDHRNFSIDRDRNCLIPYIKEALQRFPDMTLFASPWSPPTWMKSPKAYNHGTLVQTEKNLCSYADYFVRFVQAYHNEGIAIDSVHVQNEPHSDQKFPSCVWTGTEMRDFIKKYLGPAFEQAGLDTEIWAGTIERSDFDKFALTILSDPECASYVKGVGYQWDGKGAVQRTHDAWPELPIIQTENECRGGLNSWDDAEYVFNLFQHYINNGVTAYMYWNIVLQPHGISTWGWTQNSMITVNQADGSVTYNPEYYVMKHFSHYIKPDAIRQKIKGPWAGNAVYFVNPDHSRVVVVNNPLDEPQQLTIDAGGSAVECTLKPHSFNTLIF